MSDYGSLPTAIRPQLPMAELQDSIRAAQQRAAIDPQELRERETAAKAYSKENERHFVDWCEDCVRSSQEARKDIREVQAECWRVYQEKEPDSYKNKLAWQSRTVVPKPFQSIQFAAASIRKSFSPDFLSIRDEHRPDAQKFWQRTMEKQLGPSRARFVDQFIDATTMALAVGESLEMIPRFVPGRGLEFTLAEPWKIFRDPDAPPRDPQGGLFWIHQEWLDFHVLKEGGKRGIYQNIDQAFDTSTSQPNDPFMTEEAIKARRDQVYSKSKFRKLGLVSEFWGTVLSPKGEMLLPKARYLVCGGRVIRKPQAVRFSRLNWPGVAFSPLPDLLSFGGRGLLEGVRTVWEAMCTLMCLHEDGLKWIVNPMTEINLDALADPEDVLTFPGKKFLTNDTLNGQHAVRTVQRRDVTNSILANMQHYDQLFQRGTAISDPVQGLPGYRSEITWREAEQNLSQAMGVFGLMGVAVEAGAVWAVVAAQEIINQYAGFNDYLDTFNEEDLMAFGVSPIAQGNGVHGVPPLSGNFHVSGVQQLMRDAETMGVLKGTVLPLAQHPRFAPYIQPYKILQAIERRTGLEDEGVFVDKGTGEALEQVFQQQLIQAMVQHSANPAAADDAPPPGGRVPPPPPNQPPSPAGEIS